MTAWPSRHQGIAVAAVVTLVVGVGWGVKLARVAHSVQTHASYWAQPHGQPGGLLYVALGDSAAQGIGASRPDRGYVGLLAQRLRERTGRPVEVVNLSRSGAHLLDVVDTQLVALGALGRVPDVLTVGVGGNDIQDYDRERFAAAADRLTAALPDGAYVADVPYFMHGRWERDAAQAAGLLRASASRAGLRPVALHAALRAQGWRAMFTDFAADWFHPNDRGHRVWADAFWHDITPNVAAVPDRATKVGAPGWG